MADENDVAEILVFQNVDDVSDVGLETDLRASEMAPLAESSQRGGGHKVPFVAQKRRDLLPEPGPVPCRVNEDERLRIHGLRL
jgi:hypothetical protein